MTTHYIQTLGVAKCREILKGAPEHSQIAVPCSDDTMYFYKNSKGEWLRFSNAYQRFIFYFGLTCPNDVGVCLLSLRHELSLHDTDDFTHLANHISPLTIVEENLQEQFQEANEAREGQ